MHIIRLRDPWKACRDADSGALLFTRTFHRPSGCEGVAIRLCVSLLANDSSAGSLEAVTLNGSQLSAVDPTEDSRHYAMPELNAFNEIVIRVQTGDMEKHIAPKFGSYVIKSVELQIES